MTTVTAVSSPSPRRVLLIDEHPVLRRGIAACLPSRDWNIVGEAGSPAEARGLAESTPAEVAVVDVIFNGQLDLGVISHLKRTQPAVQILCYTSAEAGVLGGALVAAGALGLLSKSETIGRLQEALTATAEGKPYFTSEDLSKLLRANSDGRPEANVERLTQRERQVFCLLGRGRTTREISAELGVSVKTAEAHRENIKAKLGVPNAVALVRAATLWVENGGSPGVGYSN